MSRKHGSGKVVSAKSSIMVILPWVLVIILTTGLIASFYENRLVLMREKLQDLEAEAQRINQELTKAKAQQNSLAPEAQQEIEKPETKTILPAKIIAESIEVKVADTPEEQVAEATGTKPQPLEARPVEEVITIPENPAAETTPPLEKPAAKVESEAGTTVYPEADNLGQVIVSEIRKRRVMINLGRQDEIEPGARFTIWNQGQCVGEAKVTTVFAEMSACEVVSAAKRGIRVGDVVREVKQDLTLGKLPAD
ncbi:MAG: hypothetical protein JXA52_01315 [Planctomycetes bacterium]|nr:hypothetical protein [Planctomycetota bacterium]